MNKVKVRDYSFYEKMYQIPAGTVVWYHSGNCYSRIKVNTLEAAKGVHKFASQQTANGGYMDGVRLGSVETIIQDDGSFHYELTC